MDWESVIPKKVFVPYGGKKTFMPKFTNDIHEGREEDAEKTSKLFRAKVAADLKRMKENQNEHMERS